MLEICLRVEIHNNRPIDRRAVPVPFPINRHLLVACDLSFFLLVAQFGAAQMHAKVVP